MGNHWPGGHQHIVFIHDFRMLVLMLVLLDAYHKLDLLGFLPLTFLGFKWSSVYLTLAGDFVVTYLVTGIPGSTTCTICSDITSFPYILLYSIGLCCN